ncbi:MAG TPA: hypothetical protein PK867_30735, partial [Pirellulales bacterium]|nr:hypothetical protein [Pirellulales bacterium]
MGDHWYCQIFGEVWGPESWDDLVSMASRGVLGRGDKVKQGLEMDWVRADSVVGLFVSRPPNDETDFEIALPVSTQADKSELPSDDADFDLAAPVVEQTADETDFECSQQDNVWSKTVNPPADGADFELAPPTGPAPPEAQATNGEEKKQPKRPLLGEAVIPAAGGGL